MCFGRLLQETGGWRAAEIKPRCAMIFNRQRHSAERRSLGRWGEKRCERFLKRKGLKTPARNYCCAAGEIDLIMVDTDRSIVFVEVRTSTQETFGPPEQSVTLPKKAKLLRAARTFLAAHDISDRPFRFDVVGITVRRREPVEMRHYRNAFSP